MKHPKPSITSQDLEGYRRRAANARMMHPRKAIGWSMLAAVMEAYNTYGAAHPDDLAKLLTAIGEFRNDRAPADEHFFQALCDAMMAIQGHMDDCDAALEQHRINQEKERQQREIAKAQAEDAKRKAIKQAQALKSGSPAAIQRMIQEEMAKYRDDTKEA